MTTIAIVMFVKVASVVVGATVDNSTRAENIVDGLNLDSIQRKNLTEWIIFQLNEAVSSALKDREIVYEKDLNMRVDKTVEEFKTTSGIYCPVCGNCGEEDCDGPHRCSIWQEGFASAREKAAGMIPTNWCDSLLTGPKAVLKPSIDNGQIEDLLLGIKERIRAMELEK